MSADRLIEGSGTPEWAWRAWLGAADVPCAPWQRWLSDAERLVVVAPHPDDEVLACGALLSAHATQGGESLLIAITDGEASHADPAHGGVLQLAATRRAESAEGLKRLGLMQPRVMRLGLPDGGVSRHGDALLQSLIAALRPNDVVITTWRFDGHPDHEMTGLATARACVVQGCRLLEAPVWMWHWASPGDARVPWPRLRALHLSPVQVACKQAALAAHATQLAPRADGQGPVLGAAIRARAARDAEYFIV